MVHIGIDGLRADCIFDAPGGAPNLKKRLLEKVHVHVLPKRKRAFRDIYFVL